MRLKISASVPVHHLKGILYKPKNGCFPGHGKKSKLLPYS